MEQPKTIKGTLKEFGEVEFYAVLDDEKLRQFEKTKDEKDLKNVSVIFDHYSSPVNDLVIKMRYVSDCSEQFSVSELIKIKAPEGSLYQTEYRYVKWLHFH